MDSILTHLYVIFSGPSTCKKNNSTNYRCVFPVPPLSRLKFSPVSGRRMHRASITEFCYMAFLTMILLQVLIRTFQATEAFVYQQKFVIKHYIFKTCQTLSIVIRVGIIRIFTVFRCIFTHLFCDPRPLTQGTRRCAT